MRISSIIPLEQYQTARDIIDNYKSRNRTHIRVTKKDAPFGALTILSIYPADDNDAEEIKEELEEAGFDRLEIYPE